MSEIEILLNYNYEQCCAYFIRKYGKVPGDYFLNKECTIKNQRITRGKEGLFIHHIDEDKHPLICNQKIAAKLPFEHQKSDRLVYCNLLEHLLLHIKIFEYPKASNVGICGTYIFLIPELNDIYSNYPYRTVWKKQVAKLVINLKDDYLKCIQKLVQLNFSESMLSSLDAEKIGWPIENNKEIFEDLKKVGVRF